MAASLTRLLSMTARASGSVAKPLLTCLKPPAVTQGAFVSVWRNYATAPHEGLYRYNIDHDWVKLNEDGTATLGITAYAADQLGEIVFVEPQEVGDSIEEGGEYAVVESVKAASDLIAPISGEILEINEELDSAPDTVNSEPTEGGWIMKIQPTNVEEFDKLMDDEEYEKYCNSLE